MPSGSLVGDARAHEHFWLCASCAGRLRAAHKALLALAHTRRRRALPRRTRDRSSAASSALLNVLLVVTLSLPPSR